MNELIQRVMSKVGVNQEQAEGGLGAILALAKDKLDSGAFSQIASKVGGTDDLLAKFSSLSSGGGASAGLGGLLNSATAAMGVKADLGGVASVVGTLSSLNIDMSTIQKFAPVVSNFLEEKGLGDIATKIKSII